MRALKTLIFLIFLTSYSISVHAQSDVLLTAKTGESQTDMIATRNFSETPRMPRSAERSGFCCMIFDITKTGSIENVATTFCTESKFEKPSIKAIEKSTYHPVTMNQKAVRVENFTRLMTYSLANNRGFVIPDRKRLIAHNGQVDFSEDRLCGAHSEPKS